MKARLASRISWLLTAYLAAATGSCLAACSSSPATTEQCRVIFDRLVALELHEMGFADPALTRRKQEELAARYQAELAACVGTPLPEGAMRCVAAATTAEIVSHDCLGNASDGQSMR